jgi:hypothetical protein
MEPPYARETLPNNFAGNAVLNSGAPEPFIFQSADVMGADAEQYRLLTGGYHLYVMGWIRYEDQRRVARRTAFCRLYRVLEGERYPRFHVVKDPDYEHED